MSKDKLTALGVKAATKPGTYGDGGGLMLVVKPSGARSWILRIQVAGKRRDFGLGSETKVSLATARGAADELRKLYHKGIDPVAKKKADRLAEAVIPTFRDAAKLAHDEQQGGWRNTKHRRDWLSSLEMHAFPALGDIRIDRITAPMVRDVLLPIWLERPETASRVRQRVRATIEWAQSKGYRGGIDIAAKVLRLPKQPKRDAHFRAMAYEVLPAFMAELRAAPETMGRMALMFAILTAARSGEARGATWDEVDLVSAQWTIPDVRMKAGREHVVPLSKPALALLERAALHRKGEAGELLFPGTKRQALSDMTLLKVMRDMKRKEHVHGFRGCFKVWASETTSFPDAASEAALAHADRDKTRASYRQTDFRKLRVDLMAAWAEFSLPTSATDKVVPLRQAAG